MPRLFGRLWRSGARRAEVAVPADEDAGAHQERLELGRRLEEARQRLRQTIPPPQETAEPDGPQT